MGRIFNWASAVFGSICGAVTFGISWLISTICYYYNFVLTTELGDYSELTLPKAIEYKYDILSAQAALLPASIIAIIVAVIAYICFLISEEY